jgi:glycine cleavage system H lipoate-binding protein
MKTIDPENRLKQQYQPCIWMQAGVVDQKLCREGYNCPRCHYDRVMNNIAEENMALKQSGIIPHGKRGRIVSWKEKLLARSLSKRPCIHHMKSRIEFRMCNQEYRCGSCDFDQFFDDQYSVHAVVRPVDVLDVKGFKIPQGYYFHQGHTWMKIEESASVRVGIDDFALRLLGPLDRVEAPLVGRQTKQGRGDISIARGQNHAKILSPISGVVTSINSRLREEGGLTNRHPYSEGWVMMVKPDSLRNDIRNLMIHNETSDFMEAQVDRLCQEIEDVAGPMATDGGFFGDDILGNMPQLDWRRLTKVFLKT